MSYCYPTVVNRVEFPRAAQEETELFKRLIQAHAEEAARIGVEAPGGGKVYEDGDVIRIVSKTSEGFLVTSFDCKADDVEHKWFEEEEEEPFPYDAWPDAFLFESVGGSR